MSLATRSSPPPTAGVAPRTEATRLDLLTNAQTRRLAQYASQTGWEFLAVDSGTGVILGASSPDAFSILPAAAGFDLPCGETPRVRRFGDSWMCGIAPLPHAEGSRAVAVTVVVQNPDLLPSELILAAIDQNWPRDRLRRWAERHHCPRADMLDAMLTMCVRIGRLEENVGELNSEVSRVWHRLEQAEEEVGLLHSLSDNLQSADMSKAVEICLARLHGLVQAQGCAAWLEETGRESRMIVRGSIPFDELGLAQIAARFDSHDWSRPLVRNGVEQTTLGADFPGLRSLLIAPIGEGAHRIGWIACSNHAPGHEFGAMEEAVLTSVARMLGTHARNRHLNREQDSLLLGFVRSLVCTIDAKDPYTRGHSERVALIARRLAQELKLDAADAEDIHLSGLLHDIGKIGVDDRILRKPDRLTEEEFQQIQQHPAIGYTILSGLKSLRRILPGVRSHHEMMNGGGYPDRLRGEEIPLMARIIAVADAYDAMSSNRHYRQGMPVSRVEQIFREGSGSQWDERVIAAYFSCAEDIRRLYAEYNPSAGPSVSESGLSM